MCRVAVALVEGDGLVAVCSAWGRTKACRGRVQLAWASSGLCWRVGSSRSRSRLVRLVQGSYVQAAAETREGKRQERGLEIVLCAG